uniref:Uncharacterized protein n=1 Tax=Triticum urartu TaxID=4572 RepID=A0A8R7R805_TRIUA
MISMYSILNGNKETKLSCGLLHGNKQLMKQSIINEFTKPDEYIDRSSAVLTPEM